MKIIHKVLLIGLLVSTFPASALDGFLSNFSVKQGENIDLYISNDNPVTLSLHRAGPTTSYQFIRWITGFQVSTQVTNVDPYINGAGWTIPTYSLNTADLSPGIYSFFMKDSITGQTREAFFTIKNNLPGVSSKILLVDNAFTIVAYNNWGGKSNYATNSTGGIYSPVLSLKRPGNFKIDVHTGEFALWAQKNNIPIEYASMIDLHRDPGLLNNYNLVVVVGHSEYWSQSTRDNLDNFIRRGGNAMILSGNTMWWKVAVTADQMISHKNKYQDGAQLTQTDPDFTGNFYQWSENPAIALGNPETTSIGLSYVMAGYHNISSQILDISQFPPSVAQNLFNGGYVVTKADSWIFSGTGVRNGDNIGKDYTIVGYEVDGADYTFNSSGQPVVTGRYGTPKNTTILGWQDSYTGVDVFGLPAPPRPGKAMMILTKPQGKRGGMLFNSGTIEWAQGLWYWGGSDNPTKAKGTGDPIIQQITLNLVNRLKNRAN